MDVSFLEAPISCGSPTTGSELAYETLMAAGLSDLFPGCCPVPMEHLTPTDVYPLHLKHLDTVMAVNRRLYANTLSALEQGRFPFIIGGDHSVSMGSLSAVGEVYGAEQVAVIYIDAHPDINTDQTSVSGCIHGMDLAQSCGLCCSALDIGKQKVHILGKNIYILGGRSVDPPEVSIMEQQQVHFYSAQELQCRGVAAVLEEILPQLSGKRIHISFDVDSLDPTEFSSTGYLLPGGLRLADVSLILRRLFSGGQCVSMDCVEYNPLLDRSGRDLASLLSLFRLIRESSSL